VLTEPGRQHGRVSHQVGHTAQFCDLAIQCIQLGPDLLPLLRLLLAEGTPVGVNEGGRLADEASGR
jgi:hypothetical protein